MKKNNFKLLLLTLILSFTIALANAQTTYYVDAAKTNNTGAGTSWAAAKKDIQNAISLAASGDQIWVKAGTYMPTEDPFGSTSPVDARDKTFYLKNGVKLYGGFAGTETLLANRNRQTNVTTLSGDIGTLGTNTDNCYHVILSVSDASTTALDGFIITAGYNVAATGSITVETFAITRTLGTMLNYSSSPIISNCIFTNNTVTSGGGIYNQINSNANINNCIFTNNNSNAGGIHINASNPTISNCTFSNNTAPANGGAIFIQGVSTNISTPIITNCLFYNNTATAGSGGAISASSFCAPTITNCTIYGNTAASASSRGGAFSLLSPSSGGVIRNCIFWNNTTPSNATDPNTEEIYSNNTGTTAVPQVSVSNSIIKDYTVAGTINITAGAGIITTDPLFANGADADGVDNILQTADDGLRIPCNSPAKDVGTGSTPTLDIVGNTRTGTIDLGAYETNNSTTASNTIPNVFTTSYITQTAAVVNYTDCNNQLCKIDGTGAYTITGNVAAKLWIDATQNIQFVKRHYEITPDVNAATATGKITLYFTQQEFTDFNAVNIIDLPTGSGDATGKANLLIEKRPGKSSNGSGSFNTYTGTPVTINPTDADIVWNATASRWEVSFDVTGFSGFFVKTQVAVLPLNWLNISGYLNSQKQSVINWQVSENNVSIYVIELTTDNRQWITIGNINSKGNGTNNYSLIYAPTLQGVGFYRIKQIDNNGKFSYSSTIKLSNLQITKLAVFPNPSSDFVTIEVTNDCLNTTAQLYSIDGKLQQTITIKNNQQPINIITLPKGLYAVRFKNGTAIKFVKN